LATTITLDPVTRIEGHLRVEITIDNDHGTQQVVDARAAGTLFRGFERLLVGRSPFDAPDITQRICGVCPTSHALASVSALDQAAGVVVPNNARLLRNLVLGADFLHSHLLHFYQLAALDYLDGPAMAPWQPGWAVDRRLDSATTSVLVQHYVQALDARRKAHEMGAVFGGRLPLSPALVPGGFTAVVTWERIARFRTLLNAVLAFIRDVYIPDVETLARVYGDYFQVGQGPRTLLAFGVFDEDSQGHLKLLRRGYVPAESSAAQSLDVGRITEDVAASWYSDANGLAPASGTTQPFYPKSGAYSWIKAPRLGGMPVEVGPLARMRVNGDYTGGISVMDRHYARALEALKIAVALGRWLDELATSQPVYTRFQMPAQTAGVGLSEAPRGALGHWLRVAGGTIASYQVLTPTCWNASPRDSRGTPGPLEQALVGTPVSDATQPIEVLRVVHSYDPCLACAVHVIRPGVGAAVTVV
jgi:hydrogenase large subunit